jgi:adenylate kinase family enzyme
MKILIMGASCAGSTTLGKALSAKIGYPYFDTDHFFWEPSDVPFSVKRDPGLRLQMFTDALAAQPDHIVGGSLVSWGDHWHEYFDLIVFLYIPPEIRMQRLKDREVERYGDAILNDPVRKDNYQRFLAWAEAYDTNAHSGRSLRVHEEWLSKVTCPVLEIRGDTTIDERIGRILKKIAEINDQMQ